jgi:hypothetical protein
MQLHFQNNYGTRAWVCIMFYDPVGCGAYGNWGTRGWWVMDPGGRVYVLNTSNRYAAFYGEAADGAVWSGPYGPVLAPRHVFDSCVDIGNNVDPYVYMRLVDIRSDVHTVSLIA